LSKTPGKIAKTKPPGKWFQRSTRC